MSATGMKDLRDLETMLVGVRYRGMDAAEPTIGGMGFDKATFRPSQAYRLPGWTHDKTGQPAELWFLGGAK